MPQCGIRRSAELARAMFVRDRGYSCAERRARLRRRARREGVRCPQEAACHTLSISRSDRFDLLQPSSRWDDAARAIARREMKAAAQPPLEVSLRGYWTIPAPPRSMVARTELRRGHVASRRCNSPADRSGTQIDVGKSEAAVASSDALRRAWELMGEWVAVAAPSRCRYFSAGGSHEPVHREVSLRPGVHGCRASGWHLRALAS